MSKHTPTPWHVSDAPWLGLGFGVMYQGSVVAKCHEITPDADKHNACHIVKCVNYHDRLVEALQDMISLFPDRPANDGTSGAAWKGSVTEKYDRASAILAELSAHNGGEG